MGKPRKAPLDPAQHCRHATHDKPLVRTCWNRDRENPCLFCARIAAENRAFVQACETRNRAESYYEHIRRTDRPGNSAGTYALWAADLYEQADKDVERALSAIEASGPYADEVPIIRCHVRLMPERNEDHTVRWFELLREEGVTP